MCVGAFERVDEVVTIGAILTAAGAATAGTDDKVDDNEVDDVDTDAPCVFTCTLLCCTFELSLKYRCSSLFAFQ